MDSSIAGRHSAPLTHHLGIPACSSRRLRVALLRERKPVNRHDEDPMNPG